MLQQYTTDKSSDLLGFGGFYEAKNFTSKEQVRHINTNQNTKGKF